MCKCPFHRNEDLMFAYRKQIQLRISHLTGAILPKMTFILSRSQFPFEEIIYRDIFLAKKDKYDIE